MLKHLGHVTLAAIAMTALDHLVRCDLTEVGLRVSPIGELLFELSDRHATVVEQRDEGQAIRCSISEYQGQNAMIPGNVLPHILSRCILKPLGQALLVTAVRRAQLRNHARLMNYDPAIILLEF